ncbi:neurogenic locus notch homolog protein 1 [Trichogramma pretiosum]|uniref:EGF-like domain-containing protein n=1 Tax=Trichogramma kaykai TaxID=54128 RepID=A0ABD2VWL9_9HYME|nr:neurogenic locus notch homolog protein 1 [Trichogramma pretiosum]XP_014236299.1 neurogenic locus notch homolog protein 1 [Trichogramma pretiosum]XP_014236300.1 neurogenic locus notch homolog protein 1 [Trichogramma pretiosum]
MKSRQTAVLLMLLGLFATQAMAVQNVYYRALSGGGSSCDTHTCGINARCTISEGRPVCSCLNLHMGDPLHRCERVECLINEDCIGSRVCSSNKCVDPCAYACGTNALCHTKGHVPVCTCPPGYTGNPSNKCIYDPEAPCKDPNPCGVNTKCEVINGVATCSCLPGYRGRPLEGCRHECDNDFDCPNHLHCSANFRCENPCLSQCGESAECDVVNHRAKCTCPKSWLGNPLISCRPECTHHSDCPAGKPACHYLKCVNPCDGVCGTHANCELQDITPVCSCPKDRTGDPFTFCRPFTDEDLCQPNPCGTNAECRPGHDNTGKKRPVCTCPHGYLGNALISCQRGECIQDSECPDNRACINFSCQNPCTGRECGLNASCSPRRHIAVCTCDDGYRGDALFACNPIESGSSRTAKYVGRYGRLCSTC